MLSVEISSPTRLLFQYMKALSNSDKLRAFIEPKMIYLIKFLDNNGKYDVYTGRYIHVIYRYIDIIEAPKTLTTSCKRSRQFISSYSINNDAANLQPVISTLHTMQKIICECCGIIVHKYDASIIRGPELLPPSISRKMN